jgi:hypothetical protein
MRQTTGVGVFIIVFGALLLEFAGAGALMVSSAQAGPDDVCYGYAVCQ